MKNLIVLITVLLLLLISLSVEAQPLSSDFLLHNNELEAGQMRAELENLNLSRPSEIEYWIERLIKIDVIRDRSNNFKRRESREHRKMVEGITYYQDLDVESDFTDDKVLVEKDGGLQLGVLADALRTKEQANKDLLAVIEFDRESKLSNQHSFDWEVETFREENYLIDYEDWYLGLDFSHSEIEVLPELGFTYQTSDRTSIFADYSEKMDQDDLKRTTTVVGLEYNNDLGSYQLKYEFQDSSELESSSAGIELGVSDFAKVRAIYTLLEQEVADKEEISQEQEQLRLQLLDLGLDFNVNNQASLKLGYQLSERDKTADLEEEEEGLLQKFKPSSADIKLELKF
ncbi:hypothetical protein [Fuchsiella alkaliacetigena]|uniref:hypothetical protein n=1 Tax=Fuchsiella alkaliacetigena TaxID=957042 RepID=UPI00200AA564|nr:hypothetical protein [Fuchsiella alkaliacetigena]MCK8824290.1 hypothetical protein [Fuchsiella alkaliacetigena]